jgi:2-(1,2-epoxy-1,2-dihydrophenyl)acetyl-CoA isomerase
MSLAELSFDRDSGIATVTLRRPQAMNALDVPMTRAINAAVMPLTTLEGVRCVLLRGEGRAFIAGGDLSAFAADFEQAGAVVGEMLDNLNPVILAFRNLPVPVLASVHGAVAGAGISVMSACDLVIASEDTRFVLAYNRVGAPPDCGGTWLLPRLIGLRKAAEFMFLGDTWDAATAKEVGLVNRVVPADQLAAETDALAQRLASGATLAFGAYKRLANQAHDRSLAEQLTLERSEFQAATRTNDFREGVSTFLAKKSPQFTGK